MKVPLFWLQGSLAVTGCEMGDGYCVTHLPTCRAIFAFDSRAHAIRFAKLIGRAFRWETLCDEGWDSVPYADWTALCVALSAAHYYTSREGRTSRPEGSR